MTQPVSLAICREVFPVPTLPAGQIRGMSSPADPTPPAGTEQQWQVDDTFRLGYPAANRGDNPPTLFRLYDLEDPREIVRVISFTPGTSLMTVVRGDQGTPVVGHRLPFEVWPVASADAFRSKAQGTINGTGLVGPGGQGIGEAAMPVPLGSRRGTDQWSQPVTGHPAVGQVRHYSIGLAIPDGESAQAAAYEMISWGWITAGGGNAVSGDGVPAQALGCGVHWFSTSGLSGIGQANIDYRGNGAQSRWRMHTVVDFYGATPRRGHANTIWWQATSNQQNNPTWQKQYGPMTDFNIPTGDAILCQWLTWTIHGAGASATTTCILGGIARRIA